MPNLLVTQFTYTKFIIEAEFDDARILVLPNLIDAEFKFTEFLMMQNLYVTESSGHHISLVWCCI